MGGAGRHAGQPRHQSALPSPTYQACTPRPKAPAREVQAGVVRHGAAGGTEELDEKVQLLAEKREKD